MQEYGSIVKPIFGLNRNPSLEDSFDASCKLNDRQFYFLTLELSVQWSWKVSVFNILLSAC